MLHFADACSVGPPTSETALSNPSEGLECCVGNAPLEDVGDAPSEHVGDAPSSVGLSALSAAPVPCERVFSSSKETCTLRRSQLDPTTIKMLQVLKHLYQQEQLNFTAGILAREENYTIEGPVTESAILELLKAGKELELHELYTNWTIDSD